VDLEQRPQTHLVQIPQVDLEDLEPNHNKQDLAYHSNNNNNNNSNN
jgi:hypothetical protein